MEHSCFWCLNGEFLVSSWTYLPTLYWLGNKKKKGWSGLSYSLSMFLFSLNLSLSSLLGMVECESDIKYISCLVGYNGCLWILTTYLVGWMLSTSNWILTFYPLKYMKRNISIDMDGSHLQFLLLGTSKYGPKLYMSIAKPWL